MLGRLKHHLWTKYRYKSGPVVVVGLHDIADPVTAADRFKVGDIVTLTGENPWKGTIKVGRPYVVEGMAYVSIKLRGENGDMSYYRHERFVHYRGDVPPGCRKMPNRDECTQEYNDLIAAAEMYEKM